MQRDGRDGYTYTIDTTPGGFVVTATHTAPLPPPPAGQPNVAPPHFPVITIDQTMQIHQN